MKKGICKKMLIIGIIFFFIVASITPIITSQNIKIKNEPLNIKLEKLTSPPLDYTIENTFCYIRGTATNVKFSGLPNSKFCIMNKIRFWGSWPEPSFGSIFTSGLNGIQQFNDRSFCGFLSTLGFFDGVFGFFGAKEKLSDEPDPHGYTYSFEGFAIKVKLNVMGI
jgi:hypothetical protein